MPLPKETAGTIRGLYSMMYKGLADLMGGRKMFVSMLDSVFNLPPIFDDSYYGGVIHEIREMEIANMGTMRTATSLSST